MDENENKEPNTEESEIEKVSVTNRMRSFFDCHPRCRRNIIVAIVIIAVVIIILLPYIIEAIYYNIKPPVKFFDIQMQPSDLVAYFGTVFTLLATIALGAITLHQNKIAQEKTDEVNRLSLELQKQSMDIAEAQSKRELEKLSEEEARLEEEYAPKFEVKAVGCSSAYGSLRLSVKNVKSKIVSQFTPISLTICDKDGKVLTAATHFECKDEKGNRYQKSIGSEKTVTVTSNTKELRYSIEGRKDRLSYKNCVLTFEFSCENERGKKYYYRATANIADGGKFHLLVLDCVCVA